MANTVGDYEIATIPKRVERSRSVFRDYIDRKYAECNRRVAARRRADLPTLCFVGHGRSGKDESAKRIANKLGLTYGGSNSDAVLPVIAHSIGLPGDVVYASRHSNRMFWFEWCNEFRHQEGASAVARMTLADGDFVIGLRAYPELLAVQSEKLADLTIWVQRDGTPDDPTLEYDREACDMVLLNNGSLDVLDVRLTRLANCLLRP